MGETMREGWVAETLGDVAEQLSPGPLQDKKSCQPGAPTPVVDQSEMGFLGYHLGPPGVHADEDNPVVTFANHTAAVRLHTAPFSVIQNVFPKVGKPETCTTRYLFLVAQDRVTPGDYRGYHPEWRRSVVPIPPLPEQHRIVDLMGAVDAYVTAADARVEAARTARTALLTDLLSEVRDDWRAGPLGDFIRLQRGFDLPTATRGDGNVPVISSNGVSGTTDVAQATGPGVVTGRGGTLGKVFYSEVDYWPLNTTLFVTDFGENMPRFIAYLLEHMDLSQFRSSSAVPGVNRNVLHQQPVCLPPALVQTQICAILGSIDDTLEAALKHLESAHKFRTSLLTDLLSGAHEIPTSYDRFLEAA